MNRSIVLQAALAASMTMAAPALAADLGVVTPQQLKEIAGFKCVINKGGQATYGVHPGSSWMLDTDLKYSDPPDEKVPCYAPTGETYGILPHGKSWMVDYARR